MASGQAEDYNFMTRRRLVPDESCLVAVQGGEVPSKAAEK
jgi:hypothetical protein